MKDVKQRSDVRSGDSVEDRGEDQVTFQPVGQRGNGEDLGDVQVFALLSFMRFLGNTTFRLCSEFNVLKGLVVGDLEPIYEVSEEIGII